MKKSLLVALASFALIACTQEEVVNRPDNSIQFTNAFVENTPILTKTTDPSITRTSIEGFNVWGYMDTPATVVLDGEDVTKENGEWKYFNTQYWTPEHTYYFAALAPMDSQNWSLDTTNANEYGAGVVTFTNVDGTEDLLYTATSVVTPDMETLTAAGMPSVSLLFNHLLAKIKFTFDNGFASPNYTLEVKDIQMTAPKSGNIDLAVENWWDNDDWKLEADETTLAYGDVATLRMGERAEATNQRLTIPAGKDQAYEVTFTVVLYQSGAEAMQITKTATLTNVMFEMGKCYNILTVITPDNLGLHPIVFDVQEVNSWVHGGDYTAVVTK